MANTLVLGAGIVGAAAAWDLARRGHSVTIADADSSRCRAVADGLGIEPLTVRAENRSDVAAAMAARDVVISAVPYLFGFGLAEAAVEAQAHYLDFGGNPSIVAEQKTLHDAARGANVAIVPDCGLAPGLANVVAEGLLSDLGGRADSVQIRVGALPQEPRGSLGYQLAFSPHGLINEYAEPCEVIENGEYTTVEPLTRFETVDWPGLGPLEAFSTAGGTSTMAKRHRESVTNLEYKTMRYPGHGRTFRSLYELGLFDEEPAGIDGVSIAPRQLLLDALWKHLPRGEPDLVLIRVWAERGGKKVTAQCVDLHDGTFSALARTTAFPATALADRLLKDAVTTRGVATQNEAVSATALLGELKAVSIGFER